MIIFPQTKLFIQDGRKSFQKKVFEQQSIINSLFIRLISMSRKSQLSPSNIVLNDNAKDMEIIAMEDIVYEISEEDPENEEELEVQEDNHESDQTSFVEPQLESKNPNISEGIKKKKFDDYLNKHRPSLQVSRKNQSNLEDELSSILNVQLNNKRSQQFILKFNKKPAIAIEALIQKINKEKDNEQKENQVKASQNNLKSGRQIRFKSQEPIKEKKYKEENIQKIIAQYLLSIEGLDKQVLGEYFGKNNQKVLKIFHEFCNSLDFKDMEYDLALRKLLSKFRLPGESQQIQRIIWQFSLSFYEQNKKSFDNADQLFPLAYSIIMLATDAHNPKQQKKMSLQEFVRNTQRPCPSIGKDYLTEIYKRITKQKLQTENNIGQIIYARLRDMQTLPKLMDQLQNTKELMEGTVLLKICRDNTKLPFTNPRQSKFVQRKFFLSADEQQINWVTYPLKEGEQPRFILIKDITDLTLGIAPHLKKNNKVPKQFDSLCFTVTTTYRHLDLKAKNTKQRSQWLNYLRAVMMKRRQSRMQELQQKQSQMLSFKALEQAWNGDIFPNWDRYWDYTLKKPKKISYFRRGIQAICGCFEKDNHDAENQIDGSHKLGMTIKNNLLESLWKYGLPASSRKTLWVQIIGNPLQLNKIMIEDVKNRKIFSEKLRYIKKNSGKYNFHKSMSQSQKDKTWLKEKQDQEKFEEQVYQMVEFIITLRPDLPHVKDLLLMSDVFYRVIQIQQTKTTQSDSIKSLKPKQTKRNKKYQTENTQINMKNEKDIMIKNQSLSNKRRVHTIKNSKENKYVSESAPTNENSLICFANLIHKHHFLSFYRGEMTEIEGRTKLFEFLMEKNAPSVLEHFNAIKLETRMYLVSWFLSVFGMSFSEQFLWRIWDNFLLEEELYLFKVGITIIKYYEPQLKMCTFSEGLDLLKQPIKPSAALFFHILQNEINVTSDHYHYYIEKRKQAMIKTKVQSIPLQ